MSEYNKEMPAVRPVFDMELMLGLLQETRLGGQVMESLAVPGTLAASPARHDPDRGEQTIPGYLVG